MLPWNGLREARLKEKRYVKTMYCRNFIKTISVCIWIFANDNGAATKFFRIGEKVFSALKKFRVKHCNLA